MTVKVAEKKKREGEGWRERVIEKESKRARDREIDRDRER